MNINAIIFFAGLTIFALVLGDQYQEKLEAMRYSKYPDSFLKKLVFYAKKAKNRTENSLDDDDGAEYFHQFYSGVRDTDLDKFILQKEKEGKVKFVGKEDQIKLIRTWN